MGRNYPKIVNLSLYQSWNYLMVFFKDRENMTIWQFYNDKETSWDFEITKILWFRCWNITQICMYLKWYCCGLSHHVYYVPEQYNGFLVLVDYVNSYVFPMLLRFLFFYFFLSLEQYNKFSHGDRYVCNCQILQGVT